MLTSVGGNDLVDWDDNGNLVCDGVSSFEYNYDNKMYGASCIAEPNIFVVVGYDCENNRVSRISGDANGNFTSRKYILDYSGGLPKVLVELEPDGSGWSVAARNYHYGDRLISSVDGSGSSRFYVHDRNGNVRNVINSSGSVLNSYSYTPYGEDIAAQCAETVENRWKYTGQYEDREIGQYYLRARQYSPYLARFNGYDPVYGDYSEPFTLHQYLYCLNDPVNRTDWSGEAPVNSTETTVATGTGTTLASNSNGAIEFGNKIIERLNMSLLQYYTKVEQVYRTTAQRLGKSAEKALEDAFSYLKDFKSQAEVMINGRTRILDILCNNNIIESKNVAKLDYVSSQLKDYLAYAKENGYHLNIIVRQSTQVATSVEKWLADNEAYVSIIRVWFDQ